MKSLQGVGPSVGFILVWSSGYLVGGIATAQIAPLAVTLWRFLVAAGVLVLIAVLRRERWAGTPRELLRAGFVGLLLFGVQFGALYYGMSRGVSAGTTALVACSSPLVVAVTSHLLGWERLGPRRALGALIGVGGIVITLADRIARPAHPVELLWTLLGLAGLSAGTMLQGRMRWTDGPSARAAVELVGGAALIVVPAVLLGPLGIPLTVPALGSFAWVALISGAGAPMLMFALIAARGSLATSSLLFVVPAVTEIASWLLLGTPIGGLTLVGLVVAGVGMVLVIRPGGGRGTRPALDAEERIVTSRS